MKNQSKLIVLDEFEGRYLINDYYRPIAEALKENFEELKWVPVESILFVDNTETKKKKQGRTVYAEIKKIPQMWTEIVHQTTGRYFDFMLEIFKENTCFMNREQIIALLYHELRHIQFDGEKVDLVGHDIEDWAIMIEKLGVNWATTNGQIHDLLTENFDWQNIQGPIGLFPEETTLRVIK